MNEDPKGETEEPSEVGRAPRPGRGKGRTVLAVVVAAAVITAAIAAYWLISQPEAAPEGGIPDGMYLANAVDYVSGADWDSMQTVTVEMSEHSFTPPDLSFEAGTPYKLEIKNIGAEKHYFTAEEFYRSVALRKAQTSEGEFKAPYLKAVEVFPGDQIDVYFVAVHPGVYDSICTIPGHADLGMTGHIKVTGETPASPTPALADVSSGEWVQNAADLVSAADWNAMEIIRVNLTEHAFNPENLTLDSGKPYRLEISNIGAEKHYFTAEEFYKTAAFRKAQDGSGEIKAPYFKAIEVFPGEQIDLYLIPTSDNTYYSLCTIAGHEDAGMHGNVIVNP